MLRHLEVRKFKSIHELSVDLAPFVVIFGPNAAGKSNVLEALLLLSRAATSQTLADAFGQPVRGYPLEAFSLPKDGLPGLLSDESAELELSADVAPQSPANGNSAGLLRYRVSVRIRPKTGELQLADEYLARLDRQGRVLGNMPPRIEKDPEGRHLLVRRLGERGRPREEPVLLKHTLLSNRQFTGAKRYPDFDRLRDELASWRSYYLDPRSAMREAQPPREVTDVGSQGESIAPFLFRLKNTPEHARRFAAIGRALRAAIPTIENLDVDLDQKRGTLDVQILQQGTRYSSRVISEGTLRVLALCAIAANPFPSTLVAFEEPENGVHPRRIEVIASLLESMVEENRRQVIVTSHSPTFVSHMLKRREEAPEKILLLRCHQADGATEISPFGPAGPLFDQPDVRNALASPDDQRVLVEAMLEQGWFDG